MRKKILLVAGARPNFMKIAPVWRKMMEDRTLDPIIVHTGQHYDYLMSQAFFEDLKLPPPDIHLGVGSGTHGEQTGKILIEMERTIIGEKPDIVIVVGDVNSTIASTLSAVKLGVPTAHIEAGLRSYDRTMPEEINRLLTDAIADLLLTPSEDANENLRKEGISKDKIFLVGNVMTVSYTHLTLPTKA